MIAEAKRRKPMKRSPMKRTSSKARARQREWNAIVAARMVEMNGLCEVKWGNCTKTAEQGHHRLPRGRGGKNTRENCCVSCFNCHLQVHLFPREAEAAGFMLSGKGNIQ